LTNCGDIALTAIVIDRNDNIDVDLRFTFARNIESLRQASRKNRGAAGRPEDDLGVVCRTDSYPAKESR